MIDDPQSALKDFNVTEKMTDSFKGKAYKVFKFDKSVRISTYLFCIVAGPFACFEPEGSAIDDRIPMKLYCRHALKEEVKKMAQDWFRITKNGIHYYEKTFSTPYPFDKFDQVFTPDYAHGAMENVGLVTYNDNYVSRGEKFTRDKIEYHYNVILHEISHMWFGNLVTMKWWDDLWLNESFADFISFKCMEEAEGLEDITLAWSIFLEE